MSEIRNVALTPVDIFGALEEARHIVLEHGECLVQLLEDSDHCVVLLHILLGLSHCYLCIEASGEWFDKSTTFFEPMCAVAPMI